jgi:hypothetical protein
MCGIAGIIDLAGERTVPDEAVRRMARAISIAAQTRRVSFFNRALRWRRAG